MVVKPSGGAIVVFDGFLFGERHQNWWKNFGLEADLGIEKELQEGKGRSDAVRLRMRRVLRRV